MSSNPLPSVPAPEPSVKAGLAPVVRPVVIALLMFALLNVVREVLYLIGSVQEYGTPQFVDIAGIVRGVIITGAAFVVAGGLRRFEGWARWATLIGGFLWTLRLIYELIFLLRMRATGDDRADLQIVVIGSMIWALMAAVILLLTPKVRAAFAGK